MDRQQANQESKNPDPGCRSLRFIWYCGRINEEIRKAVKLGEKQLELRLPTKHYIVQHRDAFRNVYLNQGYDVGIVPNFKYIQPTEWIFTLGWDDETSNSPP